MKTSLRHAVAHGLGRLIQVIRLLGRCCRVQKARPNVDSLIVRVVAKLNVDEVRCSTASSTVGLDKDGAI